MRTPRRGPTESRETSAAGQTEVAAYVAALSADLSGLARRNGLATLANLLDMAKLEADNLVRTERGEASG